MEAVLEATSNKYQIRANRVHLVLNEPEKYPILRAELEEKHPIYLVAAKEIAPSTGNKHIHVFACFDKKTRFSTDTGAHISKITNATKSSKIIKYVTKDIYKDDGWSGLIEEVGEKPKDNGRRTVADIIKDDLEELAPHEVHAWKIAKSMNKRKRVEDVYKPDIKVYYIYGESGAGKTRWAINKLGEQNMEFDQVAHVNGFWTGVSDDGESKTCLYDEFRDNHMKPSEFINFIDYYKHNLNVKGGSIVNNYQTIFITSVQDTAELYSGMKNNEEPRKQWLRRMQVVHVIGWDDENKRWKIEEEHETDVLKRAEEFEKEHREEQQRRYQ